MNEGAIRGPSGAFKIKQLAAGAYVATGLFDPFYGKLDEETRNRVPPFSYFERYYKEEQQRPS